MTSDTLVFGRGSAVSRTIAVVQSPEPSLFGVASFYNRSAGAFAPKIDGVIRQRSNGFVRLHSATS